MSEKISLPTEKQKSGQSYLIWLFLFAIILSTAAIRLRLVDVPLERDEGEYAYAGRLILDGIAPYSHVYNMKLPGIYAAYAVILAVFGQTHGAIHLGLLIINCFTIVLLFLLTKKLFGSLAAIVSAAAFAVLSISRSVQGIFANAEHFVILPAIGGILVLIHAVEKQKPLSLFTAAILLGIAFLMKQHGAAFIIFAGLYLSFYEFRRKPFVFRVAITRMIIFITGVLLPFALTCLILWRAGAFEQFWFWTFQYAQEYISSVPLSWGLKGLQKIITRIINSSIMIWILAAIGLISSYPNKLTRRNCIFAIFFLVFSFLAVCPGLYFRPHYFILLLPAVAIFTGIGANSMFRLFARNGNIIETKIIPALLISFVICYPLYSQKSFLFTETLDSVSRMTYGFNPFPESLKIAEYIKEHSNRDDRIAVIGSEPQIYFYSNRHAATGYIYTYALMENHPYAVKMQEEMISQIESAEPKFLIYVNISTSWLLRPGSNMMIFDWFQQFKNKYEVVGVVDIISMDKTVFRWDNDAQEYSPQSDSWLTILRRKP